MKKLTKKIVKSKAKTRAVSRQTTTHRSSMKAGHTHSAVFSDVTLIALAVFFALFGLFAIMTVTRQNQDVESYVRLQQAQAVSD